MNCSLLALVAVAVALLCGCGGGDLPSLLPRPAPTVTATASPTPAPLPPFVSETSPAFAGAFVILPQPTLSKDGAGYFVQIPAPTQIAPPYAGTVSIAGIPVNVNLRVDYLVPQTSLLAGSAGRYALSIVADGAKHVYTVWMTAPLDNATFTDVVSTFQAGFNSTAWSVSL